MPGHDRTPFARGASRNVGGVTSNRADVRDFLVTRRAKITPQQAGLTIYGGNRRVPGLRREEVAMLAGVSADYYTRLEKGNLSGVSDTVLEAIAEALQWAPVNGKVGTPGVPPTPLTMPIPHM